MAHGNSAAIRVEGYAELQRDLKQAKNKEALRAVGAAHKETGRFIVGKIPVRPAAVGTGKGANVRPSATKRELLLMAGGKHRAERAAELRSRPDVRSPSKAPQWGKNKVHSAFAPERPNIIGTAKEHEPEIIEEFTTQIVHAMKPFFWNAE